MAAVSSVVYQCKDRLQAQLEKARESLQGVDAHLKRFNYRAKFDGNTKPRRDDRRNQERQGREQDSRRNPPRREQQSRSQRERYGSVHDRTPGHSRNRPVKQDQGEDDDEDVQKPKIMSTVVVKPKIIPSRKDALSAQSNSKTRDRDRRMFGTLLVGTLQKFAKEENQLKHQEDKKAKVEKKLEEAALMEKERVRRERQNLYKARKQKEAYIIAVEENLALIKDHEKWEEMMEPLMNQVKTVKQPHLHYIPKVHNHKSLAALERSKKSLNTMLETKREELNKIINNSMDQWKAEGLEIPSFPRSYEEFEREKMDGSANATDEVSRRNGEESWAKNKRGRTSQDMRNVLQGKRKSRDDSSERKTRGSQECSGNSKKVGRIQLLSYQDSQNLSFSDDSEPTIKIEKITPEKAIKNDFDPLEYLFDSDDSEDEKSMALEGPATVAGHGRSPLKNEFEVKNEIKEEVEEETSAKASDDSKTKNDSKGGEQGLQQVDIAQNANGVHGVGSVQPAEIAILPGISNNGDIISEAQSTNEAQAVEHISIPKSGSPSKGGNVSVPIGSMPYDPTEVDGDDEVTSTIPDVEGDKGINGSLLAHGAEKRKRLDSASDGNRAKVVSAPPKSSSSESSSSEESSSGGPPKKRVLRKKRLPKRRKSRVDDSDSSD